MRRKDREMDGNFGLRVIDKASYGVLSLTNENGEPYAVPLSLVRKGDVLYFHSAKAGTKVDYFALQPGVCVTFVTDVRVPELYTPDELKAMLNESAKTAEITSNVFTTEYASAIVYGKVSPVDDADEKREALRILCEKYTPEKMFLFNAAYESGGGRTNVYRVSIEKLTSKRKKFDARGEEMKWGRME